MKIKKYQQFNEELKVLEKYKCSVCRGALYRTDAGGHDATLQCSSDEAKFWNFPRGSEEQQKAKEHFEKSTIYIKNREYRELKKG